MEFLSSVWRSVQALTPGSKRRREDMEQHETSTARAGSISLCGEGRDNNTRLGNKTIHLVTPPETILPSAMVGLGNKKFKWSEHPPPRSRLGAKAGKRPDNPDLYSGPAIKFDENVDRVLRLDGNSVSMAGRPSRPRLENYKGTATLANTVVATQQTANGQHQQNCPNLSNPDQFIWHSSFQRPHRRNKMDASHADFYGRFWERMQTILKEHDPSLANVAEPISLYNYHYGKAVKLANRANLLLGSDTASKRQSELDEIENSISRIRTMRLQPKRRGAYPYKRSLHLPQFTDADKAELLQLTQKPRMEPVLKHEASKVRLTGADLSRLAPGNWLNDETINLYMRLLQDRDTKIQTRKDASDFPRCHFFNSFFLSKLYKDSGEYDYNAVRRWTMPARLKAIGQSQSTILEVDKVIIPVNQSNTHWTVAVIDLKNQKLEYFDSLGGEDEECLAFLAQYLVDEFKNKRAESRSDVLSWPRSFPKNIPRQQNGWDCGVFLCMFANHLAVDAELQEVNMDDYRLTMLKSFRDMEVDSP